MCGIGGAVSLSRGPVPQLQPALDAMNDLIAHRGPDGEGIWTHPSGHVGFAHRRLAIIDLDTGHQPMRDGAGNWITYNGEIYNYLELRAELGAAGSAPSSRHRGDAARPTSAGARMRSTRLRGMFAFALWDEAEQDAASARATASGSSRFYYAVVDGVLYFASEIKALLPFLPTIETDLEGFKDYLAFQFCLGGKTLFKGVQELLPGHSLRVRNGTVETRRYWEVYYEPDFDHTAEYFEERIAALLEESVALHLRSDVPVGAYLSGGLDSSVVAIARRPARADGSSAFTGRFPGDERYDESAVRAGRRRAARARAARGRHRRRRTSSSTIERVVYHLDHPVAGPGSFPQYMVSAARRASTGRWSSAARAATRSSAATRAT